jgi:hypothetical protein
MRRSLLILVFLVAGLPTAASAQADKFNILDNSFFVEEAFNQDRGIFQNIFSWARDRSGNWAGTFTQEWPAPTIKNQLSYTIPFAGGDSPAHIGGVLFNYRYQVLEETATRPAFAPRLSVILPTGRAVDDSDRPGLQFNLPLSKQVGNFYLHGNAGATWLQGVSASDGSKTNLTSPAFAGSVIWNTAPFLNLMLESVLTVQDGVFNQQQTSHQRILLISPGVRGGWTMMDSQIILGAAVPMTFTEGGPRSTAVLLYFSYELPFTSNR